MTDSREWLWNSRFDQLAEYKRTHGHCTVPKKPGPFLGLGNWVGQQRGAKQKNKLSAKREANLNSIGFVWKVRPMTKCRMGVCKTAWDTRFEQLAEYKKAKGDCNVSQNDTENIELGRWIGAQRQAKKRLKMSEEREAKLISIGFVWNIRKCHTRQFYVKEVDWNVRYRQLLAYNLSFGDWEVPLNFPPNPQLGRWVQTQRLANKTKTLEMVRREKLNSIGFDWGKYSPSHCKNTSNQQLEEPKRTHHGLCAVPEICNGTIPAQLHKSATEPHSNNRQREVLEKESVAEVKTSTDNDNWDANFRELLTYLQTNGDFNVPKCFPCNPLLARWVSEQRNDYNLKRCGQHTSLTSLREAKLDAIGFPWFVGGSSTNEDAPAAEGASSAVRPDETRSENKVRSEQVGPDHITSG